MKLQIYAASIGLFLQMVSGGTSRAETWYPSQGYVPNASTAIQIAKAVGVPLVGAESIRDKKFSATLRHGKWIVTGAPVDSVGEVFVIKISKKTGAVEDPILRLEAHRRRKVSPVGGGSIVRP